MTDLVLPGQGDTEASSLVRNLRSLVLSANSEAEARLLTSRIAQITRAYRVKHGLGLPLGPAEQALEVDPRFRMREHIRLLSDRMADAVRDVERGHNRMVVVSMPPRAGKSTLVSFYTPLWLLRRHPEWKIIMASYDPSLTGTWAKNLRTLIETQPDLGIALAPDGGAGSRWSTVEQGGMFTTSVRGGLTGRGARVFIIDDPVKDFVEAHSQLARETLWNWWLSVAQTRFEPPYLVLVVMTRWHEDDFVGRLFSPDYEGLPAKWERIILPAFAEGDDPIGRAVGDPLISPLLDESPADAIARWSDVRAQVGTYTFSAMYQQRPSPAKGAIFDAGWWRFWTMDPEKATEDGRVKYLDPSALTMGRWLDSWDAAFKGEVDSSGTGSWVVGQRWVRDQANRYLIAQQRARYTFTQTIAAMKKWAKTDDPVGSPCGHLVHERLIEEKANGAAIIDVLKEQISGLKPINPMTSKEARARAVTPEVESGNVYLPHPSDPGNEWVGDLLSELRNFPHDFADDQVDSLTQALINLRGVQRGGITVPGRRNEWRMPRDIGQAAVSDMARRRA